MYNHKVLTLFRLNCVGNGDVLLLCRYMYEITSTIQVPNNIVLKDFRLQVLYNTRGQSYLYHFDLQTI